MTRVFKFKSARTIAINAINAVHREQHQIQKGHDSQVQKTARDDLLAFAVHERVHVAGTHRACGHPVRAEQPGDLPCRRAAVHGHQIGEMLCFLFMIRAWFRRRAVAEQVPDEQRRGHCD